MPLDANGATAASKAIEALLKQRGGRGRGLHELLDSLESSLPPAVVRKARLVATMRNKVVHEADYVPQAKDERAFHAAVEAVRSQLEAVPDTGAGATESAAEALAPDDAAPEGSSPARPRRARRKSAKPEARPSRERGAALIVLAAVALAAAAVWLLHG